TVTPLYHVSATSTPISLSLASPGPCPLSRAYLPRRALPKGRQRTAPHSSSFPLTTAPLQTLHMDVWGSAPVSGTDQERYFLLVVDDYTRYTIVFPLRNKADVSGVLIPWIRATHCQLRERFRRDLPVLRLHSDKGSEFSSGLLEEFCSDKGIRQTFTLPASPQQNGIAERRIGLIMEVARTSMIHVAAPHFMWPFAVRYAAHQLNLWPCVSLLETLPTLRWTGEVGDASAFRVWGALSLVRHTTANKLSPRTLRCAFLGFLTDAPPWQFYYPCSRRSGGLTERREPASRPVSSVRTARRAPLLHPPPVPATHAMALRPSSVPMRVPLPTPPESSLPEIPDPATDRASAASPTVARLLATAVTDPSFKSYAASALVAELLDFTAACCLEYASPLVPESVPASPPSVGGECALGTDVLEDKQEDFECLAAAAITGPYSSQWQAAMDAKMASWKSTGTYVDAVPPSRANIVDGMWISKVKRQPGSPPASKAHYVARGFSQRQGVDYFHTFSPTPKMTTIRVLLHVTAQRDYELHSLDFSTTFMHGSLHEEIWLRQPPGFTGTFPAALEFAPSTADLSLFLRTDTSLPPFYVLVYVEDLVFATADTEALTLVMSELQKRHTCTDLGELRIYLGLQITRDRARRTITLTQSHMVHQVLQRFGFQFSSPQPTPLSTSHLLSAPPSDKSLEPSGPYPELVGCLVTSGMGLVLGGRGPDVLTGLADASWVDDSAMQRSSQGYTSSLGSGFVSWRSTRSSSVLSSCCEAEIYAGAMAAQELRWLTYLLTDLGEQPRSPPVLYVDNKAMIALGQEKRLEHRTKHIALRYFLARELQQRGLLRLAYLATRANTADVFHLVIICALLLSCFAFLDWSCDHLFSPTLPMGGEYLYSSCYLFITLSFVTLTGATGATRDSCFHTCLCLSCRSSSSSAVPGTHVMALRPSCVPQCAPLPSPPVSSFPDGPNPASNLARVANPAVTRLLATVITDFDFRSTAAALPRFASMLICPKGDLDALDIPTPRSYAEAIVGFSQQQGVEFFLTFSPTVKMSTLWVLLHVAAQRDYELHSLDFSTAFLQGSLHEEIWLRRPPGFTGSFPAGTKWSLQWPVYGLCQAPRKWHDTLRMTPVALGFAPSSADPSLFLRTNTSRPPFYVLVYINELVFVTADTEALALPTPFPTGHSLSAPPLDEFVEPSGLYLELVGCLMYLMTCTRLDLAYPLSLLARYVAPVHWAWGSCLEDGVQRYSQDTLTLLGPTTGRLSVRPRVTPSVLALVLSRGGPLGLLLCLVPIVLADLRADQFGEAASFSFSSGKGGKKGGKGGGGAGSGGDGGPGA
ncbi:unnamed protein product, partial [Closterium sp. NIES-53]